MKKKRVVTFSLIGGLVLLFLCSVFGVAMYALGSATSADQEPIVATMVAERVGEEVAAIDPTSEKKIEPTKTKQLTRTPRPTSTPRPQPTATPDDGDGNPLPATSMFEPITIEGQGVQVVDIQKWEGPAILSVTHVGRSNFIVENFDENGEQLDLLVNEIGTYRGRLLIDMEEDTARLSVDADGQWVIALYPIATQYMMPFEVPGTVENVSPEIYYLDTSSGEIPDLIKFNFKGDGNFVVKAVGADNTELLVNEIDSWEGVIPMWRDAWVVWVEMANGEYTIEITAR